MKRDFVLIVVVACAAFLGGLKLAEERHRTQDDALLRQVASLSEKLTTLATEKAQVIQVPAPCPPCPNAAPLVLLPSSPGPTAPSAAPVVSSQETAGLTTFREGAETVRLLVDDALVASEDYAASCAGQSEGMDSRGRQITIDNSTTPACLSLDGRISSDFRRAAAAMPLAWEKARRAGVLPGEIRRVLWEKHLDIDWQKGDVEVRRQLIARGRVSVVPQQ